MPKHIGRHARRPSMPTEEMYLAGLPVPLIAQLLSYHPVTIYQQLAKLGYHLPRGRPPGVGKHLHPKGGWCLEEMWFAGLSVDEIAELLDRARDGIRKALCDIGIKPAVDRGYRLGDSWRERITREAAAQAEARRRRTRAYFTNGQQTSETYYARLSHLAEE